MFSGPGTPTLGSALVHGGREDQERVHSLLHFLANTTTSARSTTGKRNRNTTTSFPRNSKKIKCSRESRKSPPTAPSAAARAKRVPMQSRARKASTAKQLQFAGREGLSANLPGSPPVAHDDDRTAPQKLPVWKLSQHHPSYGCPPHANVEPNAGEGPPREWSTTVMPPARHHAAQDAAADGACVHNRLAHASFASSGPSGPSASAAHDTEWESFLCGLYAHFGARRRGEEEEERRQPNTATGYACCLPVEDYASQGILSAYDDSYDTWRW
jgi:hypothetical protein